LELRLIGTLQLLITLLVLLLLLVAAGPDLSVQVNGLKLPNPFVIGSGPPGTNYQVMKKAFDEGWGAVICKTLSLDSSKVRCLLSLRQLAHGSMLAPAILVPVILHQRCSSSTASSFKPSSAQFISVSWAAQKKSKQGRACRFPALVDPAWSGLAAPAFR
jgi:hypothetical protein